MKALTILSTLLFLSTAGFSQKLSYKYPTYINKYSEEIKSEEMYREVIENFDTSTISPNYQLDSPIQIRIFDQCRLIEVKNLVDNITSTFSYDHEGNISSRTFESNSNNYLIEYKLDQEKLKLESYKDGELNAELYFNSQHKVICRINYCTSCTYNKASKKINTFDDELLLKTEYYGDDILLREKHFEYANNNLSRVKIYDEEGLLIQEKLHSYYPLKRETMVTRYSKPRNSYLLNPQSPISKEVEYYNSNGNIIKKYILTFRGSTCTAVITEYRLK